ncbi:unnamed protein product [Rotaria socialis]
MNEEKNKDQSYFDQETISLVEALKGKIKERLRSDPSTVKQKFIEDAVASVRCERKSMAYGDHPNDVKAVLEEKMNESQEETNTSLVKIITPLKALKKELSGNQPPNLCQAVLSAKNNESNRADRILFSEASCWMDNPNGYTIDIAHDQVEAIRLTHYNSQDSDQLYKFIRKNKTFDEAYIYLQNLAKEQARINSARAGTTQSTGQQQTSGSIVRYPSNDGSGSSPATPISLSSSKPYYDTSGSSSTSGIQSSTIEKSRFIVITTNKAYQTVTKALIPINFGKTKTLLNNIHAKLIF